MNFYSSAKCDKNPFFMGCFGNDKFVASYFNHKLLAEQSLK